MASPLTTLQRDYVFEILDLLPNNTAFELWGDLGRTNAVQNFTFLTAANAVDAAIALLTTEQVSIIQGLINQWLLVRTSEVFIGTAEGVKGVVMDAATQRRLIKDRLQVYIPVFRYGELPYRHGAFVGNRVIRG